MCPARHWLSLPLWCPAGWRRGRSPANPAFSLLFCPLSPQPPSPAGKGEPQSLFRRGLRPRHPCIKPFAAPTATAKRVPRGQNPRGTGYPCRCGALRGGAGGGRLLTLPLAFLLPPIPPAPFPGGEGGESKFSYARGSAPCILGACSARHWLGGRQRCPAGAHRGWSSARPAPPCSRRGRAFLLACQPCF